MRRTLTQTDMVLIALHKAAEGTQGKVPYEDIVIEAWKSFPNVFSLRNYPEHPDSSDIHKRIYQSLKPKGFVLSLGNKVFRLTGKGQKAAKAVLSSLPEITDAKPSRNEALRLSRSEKQFIEHALRTQAFSLWKAQETEKLIDYDANLFFRFSTGTQVGERKRKVDFAFDAISSAKQIGLEGAHALDDLANYMIAKFDELLEEG